MTRTAQDMHATHNTLDFMLARATLCEQGFAAGMPFAHGLKTIRDSGYTRYPLPRELLALVIDGLEGRLTGSAERLFNVLRKEKAYPSGMRPKLYWTDMAVRWEDKKVTCFAHPTRVRSIAGNDAASVADFEKGYYETTYTHKIQTAAGRVFRILAYASLPTSVPERFSILPIKEIDRANPALIRYLYSRPYSRLPREMRDDYCAIQANGTPRLLALSCFTKDRERISHADGVQYVIGVRSAKK